MLQKHHVGEVAAVMRAKHFLTCVLSQQFTIESDQKPLDHTSMKTFANDPAYLYCILLHLQIYDLTLNTSWDVRCSSWLTLLICSWTVRLEPAGPQHSLHAHHLQSKGRCPADFTWWSPPTCSCRDNPGRMAWWPQRCPYPHEPSGPWWCAYSWGWNHPPWRNHCCSVIGEGRCTLYQTKRSPMHHKIPAMSSELCLMAMYEDGHPMIYWAYETCPYNTLSSPVCHYNLHQQQGLHGKPNWLNCSVLMDMNNYFQWLLPRGASLQWIPLLQCKSTKVILILKELFAEYCVLGSLKSSIGTPFNSTLFAEVTDSWKLDNVKALTHKFHANGFAESSRSSKVSWQGQVLWTGSPTGPTFIMQHIHWLLFTLTYWTLDLLH